MLARPDRPVIKFPPRHLPDFPMPVPQPDQARDQAAFDLLDSDGNGKISQDEFKRAGVPEDRQKLMDADGDGQVNEQEYTQTRRYEREFNDKDQNGDGSLNRDEMNPFHLTPLPQPFPIGTPWLTKLAAKAGLIEDKGGAAAAEGKAIGEPDPNSTIWHNPGFFPQLKDRFARFDKDGDGKVTKEEYVEGRRAENKPRPIFDPPIDYKGLQADVGATKKEIVSGTDTLKLSSNATPKAPDDQH